MQQGSAGFHPSPVTAVRGLILATHPLPSIVVTAVALILGLAVGLGTVELWLVAAMVLTGQLSVGWSNDWIDAARDTAVERPDKPIVTGMVSRRAVGVAAVAAVVVSIGLGFALAPAVGVANVLSVASAWAYNGPLKSTLWSWLPFAVSFGILPALVTFALPGSPWPMWWVVAAGALLGVAAHFTNVLPDLEGDRRTGVSGLPHRLGARASGLIPFIMMALVSVLVGIGQVGTAPRPGTAVGVVLGLAIAVTGIVLARTRRPTRSLMRLIMLGALVNVATLAATGMALVVGA